MTVLINGIELRGELNTEEFNIYYAGIKTFINSNWYVAQYALWCEHCHGPWVCFYDFKSKWPGVRVFTENCAHHEGGLLIPDFYFYGDPDTIDLFQIWDQQTIQHDIIMRINKLEVKGELK